VNKILIVIIILVFCIAILFFLTAKQHTKSQPAGFQQPKSEQKIATDSLSMQSKRVTTNFRMPYSGDELLRYLLPNLPKETQLVTHTGYTLAYNEKYEQAVWVSYILEKKELHGENERNDRFIVDPAVQTGSATPKDYTKSGFDKGHLAPAGDMSWSQQAMKESFYMSNMSPQTPQFNRGIWKDLESEVRNWAASEKELYIVTGPIFDGKPKQFIGPDKVAVPDAYYKIVLDYEHQPIKAVAFIIPNAGCTSSFWQFSTSIDNVEQKTGINFFPQLPDSVENRLESEVAKNNWLLFE
jgi:endonuclease G